LLASPRIFVQRHARPWRVGLTRVRNAPVPPHGGCTRRASRL